MKKSTKTFTGSMAALATVAGIIAPSASVLAEGLTVVEQAKDAVAYAEKTVNFFDWNLAFGKVVALGDKEPQYFELLARLSKIEETVKTPEVKAVLTAMDALAANKDLTNFYNIHGLAGKVTNANDMNYLLNELNTWGKTAVFTPEVVAATDAIIKAWTDKTPESIAAAKAAAAKLTSAGNLSWVNGQIAEVEATMPLVVKSIAGAGEKALKVTFSKPVADASKLTLTVKRDDVKVNVASIAWNADKTVATLTTSYKIQSGEYVATAKYDTADATVTAETDIDAAEVSVVEFNSTDAVTTEDGVAVKVTIYNQYGEDMTDAVDQSDLRISSTEGEWDGVFGDDNTINIAGDSFEVGDEVSLTVVHKPTATVKTAKFKVVKSAEIASIVIGDLTPDDEDAIGDVVYAKTDLDGYYLPLTVKDQYGNVLSADQLQSLTLISSDEDVVAFTMDGEEIDMEATIVDLDDQTVIRLADTGADNDADGTAVITVVAASGVSTNKKIVIAENPGIDKLTLQSPEDVLKEDDSVVVPFEAIDQYGTVLVSKDDFGTITLNDDEDELEFEDGTTIRVTGGTISYSYDYDNDEALELKVNQSGDSSKVVVTVITSSGKVQNLTINVEDAAEPNAITGLSTSFKTLVQNSGAVYTDLKNEYVTLEDQYGDEFTLTDDYSLEYSFDDDDQDKFAVSDIMTDGEVTGARFTAAADKSGTTKVTVTLKEGTTVIDEYTFTLESVDKEDITGYGIEDLDKMYSEVDGQAEVFTLYGLKDNKKVKVDQTLVTNATVNNGFGVVASTRTITAVAKATDGADKTAKLTVIVDGEDGPITVTKNFVYSDATPVVTVLELQEADEDEITSKSITIDKDDLNTDIVFYAEDQYGEEVDPADLNYSITNRDGITAEEISIVDGVFVLADDVVINDGESFTLTVMTNDGTSKTLKIFFAEAE